MATQGILVGPAGYMLGRPAARFVAAVEPQVVSRTKDMRFTVFLARGTVTNNNRVMVKADPAAPEVPMAGARVRLHRLADGYCAWQGISDADGYYWPTGLEVGVEYYPVAIDLTREHECDAAGPVVAVEAP